MKDKKIKKKKSRLRKPRGFFPKKKVALPKTGTVGCKEYFTTWFQINDFFNYLLNLVIHIEGTAKIAHKTLIETAHDKNEKERLIKEWETYIGPIEQLKKHRQFLLEVILTRHVNNYLNYLSSLLMEIFVQRPETLRSSEKIDLEEALKHDTIGELVLAVAERKVESLSYSSFQDLYDYFKEKFNLILFEDSKIPEVVNAIEIRNISVHNRCIINKRFIKRTGNSEDKVGKLRKLGIDYLYEIVPTLAESVKCLDRNARKSLKLRGMRFSIQTK